MKAFRSSSEILSFQIAPEVWFCWQHSSQIKKFWFWRGTRRFSMCHPRPLSEPGFLELRVHCDSQNSEVAARFRSSGIGPLRSTFLHTRYKACGALLKGKLSLFNRLPSSLIPGDFRCRAVEARAGYCRAPWPLFILDSTASWL